LPKAVDNSLLRLNRNLAFAILSGNIRSALIQPTACVNTAAAIGPKYTWRGIESLLDPIKRNEALEKSNVLLGRQYDIAAKDAFDAIRSGKWGEIKRTAGEIGLKPLQILDMETARATWQGAYEMAKEKLGLKERESINYADDVVTKTQASAAKRDLAPIQRTALGKFISLFQTFVINQWGFITRDVLGVRNPNVRQVEAFKKATTFIVAATLGNVFYEDVLGVNSPYPTPIKAFGEAIEEGAGFPSASVSAAKEVIEFLPIIGGGLRYGGGLLGAGADVLHALTAEKKTEKQIETIMKIKGIPFTSQMFKTLRGLRRGLSVPSAVIGQKYKRTRKLKP